jgi:hypothetical protein
MLETIHIPILLKAIDFVFDEGRKILEERRERRKLNDSSPQSEAEQAAPEPPPPEAEEVEEIKQDLRDSKVDEILWQNHEAEVQHLVRLLEIYSKNYYLAREQYAKWGSALVPPIILNNLSESEASMLATIQRLEAILSKIYKKDIAPIK